MTMPAPSPQALPPALTAHARGFSAGLVSPQVAQLVLHNPVVHAVANMTRAELRQLVETMADLVDAMEDAPAASALVLPEGAGKLAAVTR